MRRNSDSSIASKIMSPEEERRRRERHRRERDSRHRHGSGRDGRSKKPVRNLDMIDSLDVTSIYGKGCESSSLDQHPKETDKLRSVPS